MLNNFYRIKGAAIQYNTKQAFSSYTRKMYGAESNKFVAKMEKRRIAVNTQNKIWKKNQKNFYKKKYYRRTIRSYGEKCDQSIPTMAPDRYQHLEKLFIDDVVQVHSNRIQLEIDTKGQSLSTLWKETREKIVTMSYSGRIGNARSTNSYKGILKSCMQSKGFTSKAIKHGNHYENFAREQFMKEYQLNVEPCGLYLDDNVFYLGASPDGIVRDKNAIIEIKCPFYEESNEAPLDIRDAIEKKIGSIFHYLKIGVL